MYGTFSWRGWKNEFYTSVCLVPRPHYSARSMRFGSRGPSKSVHRNALTEKAWENALHRLGNTCVGLVSFSSGTTYNVGERAIAKRLVCETWVHYFLGSFTTYLPIYYKTLWLKLTILGKQRTRAEQRKIKFCHVNISKHTFWSI